VSLGYIRSARESSASAFFACYQTNYRESFRVRLESWGPDLDDSEAVERRAVRSSKVRIDWRRKDTPRRVVSVDDCALGESTIETWISTRSHTLGDAIVIEVSSPRNGAAGACAGHRHWVAVGGGESPRAAAGVGAACGPASLASRTANQTVAEVVEPGPQPPRGPWRKNTRRARWRWTGSGGPDNEQRTTGRGHRMAIALEVVTADEGATQPTQLEARVVELLEC